MVDQAEMYALTGEPAWTDFPHPGFRRQADGLIDLLAHCDNCHGQDTLIKYNIGISTRLIYLDLLYTNKSLCM